MHSRFGLRNCSGSARANAPNLVLAGTQPLPLRSRCPSAAAAPLQMPNALHLTTASAAYMDRGDIRIDLSSGISIETPPSPPAPSHIASEILPPAAGGGEPALPPNTGRGSNDAKHSALRAELDACETWQDVNEVIADEVDAMSLASAVHALGGLARVLRRLPREGLPDLSDPAFQQLFDLLHANSSVMTPMQLCTTLQRMVQLEVPVLGPVLATYASRISKVISGFSLRDISGVLRAFSQMGVSLEENVINHLVRRAHTLLFDQAKLLSIPSPMPAPLQGKVEDEESDGASSTSTSTSMGAAVASATASSSPSAAAAAPAPTPAHIDSGSAAIAVGGRPDFRSCRYFAQDLCMVLHSLVSMNYTDAGFMTMAGVYASARLADFSPQGVSNVTMSFMKLDYYHEPLIKGAVEYFVRCPTDFKPQETCNLMWALVHARYDPGRVIRALIGSLMDRMDMLKPADLCMMLTTMATFCVHPGPKSIVSLAVRMEELLDRFSPLELSSSYLSLGLLGETALPLFQSIGQRLGTAYEAGQLNNEGLLRQAFQGLLCAKLAAPTKGADEEDADVDTAASSAPVKPMSAKAAAAAEAVRKRDNAMLAAAAPPWPHTMLDSMRRVWGTSTHKPAGPSKQLKQVLHVMNLMRVAYAGENQPTNDGLYSVDVVLKPRPGKLVALQLVLEHEHTRNTRQFLGTVRLERQILERNGYEVKYLLSADWKAAQRSQEPQLVADLLISLGYSIPEASITAAKSLIIDVQNRTLNKYLESRKSAQHGGGGAKEDTTEAQDRTPSYMADEGARAAGTAGTDRERLQKGSRTATGHKERKEGARPAMGQQDRKEGQREARPNRFGTGWGRLDTDEVGPGDSIVSNREASRLMATTRPEGEAHGRGGERSSRSKR